MPLTQHWTLTGPHVTTAVIIKRPGHASGDRLCQRVWDRGDSRTWDLQCENPAIPGDWGQVGHTACCLHAACDSQLRVVPGAPKQREDIVSET